MCCTLEPCQVLTATDYRLVPATVRLTIKPVVKRRSPEIKTLKVDRLPLLKEEFQDKLESKLAPIEAIETEPENMWQDLKDAVRKTTAEIHVVGFSSRKNEDWFDENEAE